MTVSVVFLVIALHLMTKAALLEKAGGKRNYIAGGKWKHRVKLRTNTPNTWEKSFSMTKCLKALFKFLKSRSFKRY